jgi:hypothetical protein
MQETSDSPKEGTRSRSTRRSKSSDESANKVSKVEKTEEKKEKVPEEKPEKKSFIEDPFKPGKKIENPDMVYMILDKNVYDSVGDESGEPVKRSVPEKVKLTVREYEVFTQRKDPKSKKEHASTFDNLGYKVQKLLYHPNQKG